MRRVLVALALSILLTCFPGVASRAGAGSYTCERVTRDFVALDGMLDDWQGLAKRRAGGQNSDASLLLRCVYDDRRLYVALHVFDDRVFRSKRPSKSTDDHLEVVLSAPGQSAGQLVVFPGNDQVDPARTWNGKSAPSWLAVQDTLQKKGWSLELAIPLARIPGFSRAVPGVSLRVAYRDADRAARIDSTVQLKATLELAHRAELFRSFLAATGLEPDQIRLDTLANVDDEPGPERVVAGRNIVGILSDRFFYIRLPTRSARDVSKVEVVDLRGDGTMSIVTQFRQYGNGGSRDVVAVWQSAGNGKFERSLAFEVRKQLGDHVLVNRWYLVPRDADPGDRSGTAGKTKPRGHDMVVEVSERDVVGWDQDSYSEAPAVDVLAILKPWSEPTSAVYSFEGNTVIPRGPRPTMRLRKR